MSLTATRDVELAIFWWCIMWKGAEFIAFLVGATSLTLTTSPDRAAAQCAPGYRCGGGANRYVGPRQRQVIPRALPQPTMRFNPSMARAFPMQTARGLWNNPTVTRGRQIWNTPPVRDIRGIYSTGTCLATGSNLSCMGAGSYMAYNANQALRQPNPVTTPAYILNGNRYYYTGPGTAATTTVPLFPRQ